MLNRCANSTGGTGLTNRSWRVCSSRNAPAAAYDQSVAPGEMGSPRRDLVNGSQWYNSSYTVNVKTAVSLPDELFELAEATARRLGVSRSELYAKAIAEYVKQQQGQAITERLNDIYSRRPAKLDAELLRAQLQSVEKDHW